MTLQDFRAATQSMPPETEILVLSPWGEMEPAAFARREDISEDDPILAEFPPHAVLIAPDADLPLNITLTPQGLAAISAATGFQD